MSFSQAEDVGGVGDFQDRSILLPAKSVAKAIMSTSLEVLNIHQKLHPYF